MTRKPLIDRPNRQRVAIAVRKFLANGISAFQFDQEIYAASDATTDATVKRIVAMLWHHYDDCRDHRCTLSKAEWDYFQRLLLVLDSDANIVVTKTRRWIATQALALAALLLFGSALATCIAQPRFEEWWMLLLAPFGVLSIFLGWLRLRLRPHSTAQVFLAPFASFSELSKVRRRTTFVKEPFPEGRCQPPIRGRLDEIIVSFPFYVAWIAAAPLVLIWQTLPDTEYETGVVI